MPYFRWIFKTLILTQVLRQPPNPMSLHHVCPMTPRHILPVTFPVWVCDVFMLGFLWGNGARKLNISFLHHHAYTPCNHESCRPVLPLLLWESAAARTSQSKHGKSEKGQHWASSSWQELLSGVSLFPGTFTNVHLQHFRETQLSYPGLRLGNVQRNEKWKRKKLKLYRLNYFWIPGGVQLLR